MTILISALSFLVAIAILVGIHEFGHFWVARKLGIKIIRFAIGFGKPIWTYKSKDKDKTEYVLAAIPMGGYVKMLDEREGDVAEEEKHRAFNTQPVWKRFLVVLAGPMFNFFFAIAAFAAIQMMGIESVKPYVGDIQASTPAAQSGFEKKDLITGINDIQTDSMRQVRLTLLNEYLKNPQLKVHVKTESGSTATRDLDLSDTLLLEDEGDYFAKTGMGFWQPPHATIINTVIPGKPAEQAGLMVKDKVIKVDGNPVVSTEYFSKYISGHADKSVELLIDRQGEQKTLVLTPKLTEIEGQQRALIGVGLAREFDEKEVNDLFFIREAPFFEALQSGVVETWDMSIMTLKVMGRLITGEASLKNISGPITIANYAGKSALIGFSAFLTLLAIVSLSLGVLNLLPIPMLDGGHLLYYIIELVKGSPVSERVEAIGMRIGMSVVGVLMVVAIYNDIGRLIN
ncbi:RIP metalloprotease RseP [Cocleimonas sp. KMM 6892]|uniref:RIP metalloprotease RseP n=1 Tax=unclassified Cocleimonas TaxID=2639732 RepID=UPI002DB7E742|nr:MULTISPECIES: RIP metalloprotease RseP [unclassified Cocleimonas]MEB8431019.1 RIP metalloprotease RseP [Cocleimonas sp. KMM 6892]MEC4714209.1 RIP metalloprotease RseP [Cocleimonas sp. KMM 6895]MEC4743540.1 RIP metalloprotease RseP [Cocleimonas sp. KMM 6896]